MILVNACRSCQPGYRKTISTRRRTVLHSAAVRLLRTARAADTDLDLDGPRASLLSVLVFAGPQPVTRLAELEQVSAPAITKMVSALESTGLAQRERSETDRRVVLVSATPPESVSWSGAEQPGYERSPHCLLTPPRRSCRPCAPPQTSLRTGSRGAAL